MLRTFKLSIVVTVGMLALFGSASWLYAIISKPTLHPLNGDCATCHMAGAATTPANASMLVASQEQLCGECHANALKMSHPSGIAPAPGKVIPAQYPLDWKGDLTCSTCHEVHSDALGKMRGAARGQQLCLSCHNQAFFNSMLDGGSSVMMSGHLGMPNSQNWQSLDPYSVQCMECHAARGDVAVTPGFVVRHGSQNHPVGRRYADAERYGGYRPEIMLSKKINLPNGMVSCVSCHETFTKNHGKVISTSNTTALCFECHDI